MVAVEIVKRKVAEAEERLQAAELRAQRAQASGDVADSDLAAFYLFLAIQEVIDLAAHWVSDAGWPAPAEAGKAFFALADHGAIDRDLANALHKAVGLRNRIAHLYPTIDHQRIFAELPDGARSLRSFLVAVAEAAGI